MMHTKQDDVNNQDIDENLEILDFNKQLGILDQKCSALLQVSTVVLALNIIPAVSGDLDSDGSVLSAIISIVFLSSSLLSLLVLWINWKPTEKTIHFRTTIYRICIFLTAVGLTVIAALMIDSLNLLS